MIVKESVLIVCSPPSAPMSATPVSTPVSETHEPTPNGSCFFLGYKSRYLSACEWRGLQEGRERHDQGLFRLWFGFRVEWPYHVILRLFRFLDVSKGIRRSIHDVTLPARLYLVALVSATAQLPHIRPLHSSTLRCSLQVHDTDLQYIFFSFCQGVSSQENTSSHIMVPFTHRLTL